MDAVSDTTQTSAQDAMFALIQSKQAEIAQQSQTKQLSEGSNPITSKGVQAANQLSNEEQSVVDQLKARDKEVRDHEQAHARVGGAYASEPSYSYQIGPDGNRYAVGGEVKIDVAPIANDPEATIAKMTIVKAAALAPAEPSSADRQVAALAENNRGQAQAELMSLQAAERRGENIDMRA